MGMLKEVNFSLTDLDTEAIDFLKFNLTPRIEKLSLWKNNNLTIKHNVNIEALLSHFKNLTALDLRSTRITNTDLDYILDNLKSTLEILDISHTNINHLSNDEIQKIKSMPKLKYFNCNLDDQADGLMGMEFGIKNLKQKLSHLNHTSVSIGAPQLHWKEKDDEFWEIKAKQLDLFTKSKRSKD